MFMNDGIAQEIVDARDHKGNGRGTLHHAHQNMHQCKKVVAEAVLNHISSIQYVRLHIVHRINDPGENGNEGADHEYELVEALATHFGDVREQAAALVTTHDSIAEDSLIHYCAVDIDEDLGK